MLIDFWREDCLPFGFCRHLRRANRITSCSGAHELHQLLLSPRFEIKDIAWWRRCKIYSWKLCWPCVKAFSSVFTFSCGWDQDNKLNERTREKSQKEKFILEGKQRPCVLNLFVFLFVYHTYSRDISDHAKFFRPKSTLWVWKIVVKNQIRSLFKKLLFFTKLNDCPPPKSTPLPVCFKQ